MAEDAFNQWCQDKKKMARKQSKDNNQARSNSKKRAQSASTQKLKRSVLSIFDNKNKPNKNKRI